MPKYRYRVVDVFTERPLEGNALAVFPQASGIDDLTMQKIARELNLSETVFLLPPSRPDCAARARIFTPSREMEFAGHPTVGACYVILDEDIVPRNTNRFQLEENVGPVPIRVDAGERPLIWLKTPPISSGITFDRQLCAQALALASEDLLDVEPQMLSAGNDTILVALRNKEAVDKAHLELAGIRLMKGADAAPMCVFIFAPTPEGAYSRMFAPEYGVVEDPATGSSTGPLAAYMMRHALAPHVDGTRFLSEQGTHMQRRSFLHIQINGEYGADGIEIGGHVTPLVEASMSW